MPRDPQVITLKLSAKRLPPGLVEAIRRLANRILGLDRLQAMYGAMPPCEPAVAARVFLDSIKVHSEYSGLTPQSIPPAGALLVVANHPFGLVDGLSLEAMLSSRRPDVAVMVLYEFAAVPEIKARAIFVDPHGRRRGRLINLQGWLDAFACLARGGVLVTFPAGSIARFSWRRRAIVDPPWSPHIAALARRSGARVLPIYFHGHNRWRSQLVGMAWPRAQVLLALREVSWMRGKTLRATVGRLIEADELARFSSDAEAIDFLRRETEGLRSVGSRQ
jgi:putative hemolysin